MSASRCSTGWSAGRSWCARRGRQYRISPSRFYELRRRYRAYGEAGLLPKPRPATRPSRQVCPALRDAIIGYAVEHPTHGPRTIAATLALARFGGWVVSHGGVYNVLVRARLSRISMRLAAAELLAVTEGGPVTERALRDLRAVSSREERTVVIGLSTAVRSDLLANVARTFSRMHPGHQLRVRQSTFEDASAGLADGECDVAFVWLPIPGDGEIAHTVLFEEPRHVAVPGRPPPAGRKAVAFNELLDEPFLALPEETGPQRSFWLAEEERGGRPARIGAVVRGPEEAVAALNAGLGVALISASNAATYPRAGYITVPVLGVRTCALAVAWRKADTRIVVRDLVDAAVAVATERVAAPA